MSTIITKRRQESAFVVCDLYGCSKISSKIQAIPCFAMVGLQRQRCNRWFCTEEHQFEHVLIHKDD